MSDSTSTQYSSSSAPNPSPSSSSAATLGTTAAAQAQSAQIHKAAAQEAPKTPSNAPNSVQVKPSAPKQAAQAQATINDPNASKAQKAEAKKTLKKLTYKVDGQEFTEELPFEIPDDPKVKEYMTRELQMSRMGQKRAQHAATLEKEVTQLIKDIQTDPFKVLADPAIKVDVKAAVQKWLEKQIEDSNKSPEQLALEKAQEEIRQMRAQQEADKQNREAQEHQAMVDKYEQEYDAQISQALESNQIPKSPAAVKKILAYAELAVAANKDVSVQDILPFVKEELINDYREHARALPDDALENFFGKDLIDRVRKVTVKKAKAAQANPAVQGPAKVAATGKTGSAPAKPEEKMSYKQFFKKW